jgi:HprK-related kinase A
MQLYAGYELVADDDIVDFHVSVERPKNFRRWVRPQVRFYDDGVMPFDPLPVRLALPILEWGMNWCVATHANHFMMLHSAVVERNGNAVLFPAWPGHGKTTLCSGLVLRGWRLFSDEFGLVRPGSSAMVPFPRLLPLKNESIEIIRSFSPQAFLGPSFPKTRKGTVAHMRPPAESVARSAETAEAKWIVFPRWRAKAPLQLKPMPRSQAFLMLATNSFNYEVLRESSFRSVAHLIRNCRCYRLVYSELDEAVEALDNLIDSG